VDALPDRDGDVAKLEIQAVVRNTTATAWQKQLGYRVVEEETGQTLLEKRGIASANTRPGEARLLRLPAETLKPVKLWHFDHPNLYTLTAILSRSNGAVHELSATFGVRSIEVKNGGSYLNGERLRLMGLERMAGSNPEFGMAESGHWITHDHDDLKNLNCVFTRAHWPQDKRVLDYCDRHGIFFRARCPPGARAHSRTWARSRCRNSCRTAWNSCGR
jgi:beta-glucuronidase